MINWKLIAKKEHNQSKRMYDQYRECQDELNRIIFPGGAKLRTPTRKEVMRPARVWAAIVQGLERDLRYEQEYRLRLVAELEGWKSEALAARATR